MTCPARLKFVLAHDEDQRMQRSRFRKGWDVRSRSSDLFAAQHVLTDDQ